jgi:hypothetical protein
MKQRKSGLTRERSKKPAKKSVTEEKISLYDLEIIKADEKFWTVKLSIAGHSKKVKRVLVAGPEQLRLLIPITYEEAGKFPYKKFKQYSYNEAFKMFEFTWYPSPKVEESYFFKTSKGKEIQTTVGNFIKDFLKQKKGVENPELVLQRHTFSKPAQVERIKVGGRQRCTLPEPTKSPRNEPKSPRTEQSLNRSDKSVKAPLKKKKPDVLNPSPSVPVLSSKREAKKQKIMADTMTPSPSVPNMTAKKPPTRRNVKKKILSPIEEAIHEPNERL